MSIKNSYEQEKLRRILSGYNLKRKPIREYKKMPKDKLYLSLISAFANYDRMKAWYVNIKLENNFLKRQLNLLKGKGKVKHRRKIISVTDTLPQKDDTVPQKEFEDLKERSWRDKKDVKNNQ